MSTTSEATGNDRRNLVNIQRIQIHKHHHQRFKSLCAYIVNGQVWRTVCWRGVWIWLIKKRGTDKVFFCKNSFKSENKYFSPEPIYSNSNAMFFVEEKGSKFQVKKRNERKTTYFFLKIYKVIVAGEQDGLLWGGGRPVLWDRGSVPLHPCQQVLWHLLPT